MLPNPNILNICKVYQPLIVPDEVTMFYINFQEPISQGQFSNWVLGIMQDYQREVSDVGTLVAQQIASNKYNIYGQFTCPDLPEGEKRLVIYNSNDGQVYFVSNILKLQKSRFSRDTVKLKYRNSLNLRNWYYAPIPDFFNEVRVHMWEEEMEFEEDREILTEATTGFTRNIKINNQLISTIKAGRFDRDAHLAAGVLAEHDTIYINNTRYAVKDAYKPEKLAEDGKSYGEMQIYESRFGTNNYYKTSS